MASLAPAHPTPVLVRVLAALLALCAVAGLAQANSYEWRAVRQRVEIHADGSVEVEDTRTLVATEGDFGEAFVCIAHTPFVALTLDSDASGAIDDGPAMPVRSAPCASGAQGTELIIGESDTRFQERRVRFAYRLDGALDIFGDVVQWYWPIYGYDNVAWAIDYHLTLLTPGSMAWPYYAYVHGTGGSVERSDDRVDVYLEHISPGDGVTIRYLMDPDVFVVRGEGERLDALIDHQNEILYGNPEDAPWLFVDDVVTTTATAVITGEARPINAPIFSVSVWRNGVGRSECAGKLHFRCELSDLPVGLTDVWVQVEAANDTRAEIHVEVERR